MLKGPTEIRTRVSGFKVLSDNHYTMRPKTPHTIFIIDKDSIYFTTYIYTLHEIHTPQTRTHTIHTRYTHYTT